jgi:hydrogenase-4 component E
MTTASNLLAFLGLVITLLLVWRESWRGRIRFFVAQSVVLAALAATIGVFANRPALFAVAAGLVGVKVGVIPRVLRRMAGDQPLRPVMPGSSAGVRVLVAGLLVVVAYVIMLRVTSVTRAPVPTHAAMPLAFAIILIGLFACVIARDAVGQVIGFLVFENGVFALALLATYGLPGIVEAGVFLEVVVLVLLMEGVVLQIRREHDSVDVERLRDLRG